MRSSSLNCSFSSSGSSQWNWALRGVSERVMAILSQKNFVRHYKKRYPARLFKLRQAFSFLNGRAGAAEPSAMEDQRRLGFDRALLDLADEDHVVAFRVAAAVVAFEPGGHALQDRLAGARQLEGRAVEGILAAAREAARKP